jgi:hypothetical protein
MISALINNSNTMETENTLLTQLLLDMISKKSPYYWLNNNSYINETTTEISLPEFVIKIQRDGMDYIIKNNEVYNFPIQIHESFNKILFLNITFNDTDKDDISIMEAEITNTTDRDSFISAYNSNDYNSIFNNANNILINNLGSEAGDVYFPILLKLNNSSDTYTIDLRSKLNDYMNYLSTDSKYEVKFNINNPVIEITDSSSNVIEPNSDGTYTLINGTYNYTINKPGFDTETGTFTVGDSNKEIDITLTETV